MLVYLGIDWSEQKHDLSFQNELELQKSYTCGYPTAKMDF